MTRQIPSRSRHRITTTTTTAQSDKNSRSVPGTVPNASVSRRAQDRSLHDHSEGESETNGRDVQGSSPGSSTFNSSSTSISPQSVLSVPPPSTASPSVRTSTPIRSLAPLPHSPVDDPETTGGNVMDQLQAFFSKQGEFNRRLEQRLEEHLKGRENQPAPQPIRFSKALSAHVRDVYSTLTGVDGADIKWDLLQNFSHEENKAVNAAIIDGVRSTDTNTPSDVIRAAMRAHFRTKKRQLKNKTANVEKEVLQEQRIRSRKNTKRLKRCKTLNQSTSMTTEDKEKYRPCLKVEYMSSEHSASEDNSEEGNTSDEGDAPRRKVLCRRPLQWRSPELNNLFGKLDRKLARRQSQRSQSMMVKRRDGPASTREAPENAPALSLL